MNFKKVQDKAEELVVKIGKFFLKKAGINVEELENAVEEHYRSEKYMPFRTNDKGQILFDDPVDNSQFTHGK